LTCIAVAQPTPVPRARDRTNALDHDSGHDAEASRHRVSRSRQVCRRSPCAPPFGSVISPVTSRRFAWRGKPRRVAHERGRTIQSASECLFERPHGRSCLMPQNTSTFIRWLRLQQEQSQPQPQSRARSYHAARTRTRNAYDPVASLHVAKKHGPTAEATTVSACRRTLNASEMRASVRPSPERKEDDHDEATGDAHRDGLCTITCATVVTCASAASPRRVRGARVSGRYAATCARRALRGEVTEQTRDRLSRQVPGSRCRA
jgi:hypothetical protein